jgi:hypothetical protein
MQALIIVNHHPAGRSIQRYLKYLFQYPSEIIDFTPLKEKGIFSFPDYDLVITDIYDETGINYGLQFGSLFEKKQKRIVYFFSAYSIRDGYNFNNLPGNCFYIPSRLPEFLRSFSAITSASDSSEKLMTILDTNPLTSSHH